MLRIVAIETKKKNQSFNLIELEDYSNKVILAILAIPGLFQTYSRQE